MRFLNLEKLKVEKDFNFNTITKTFELDNTNESLISLNKKCEIFCAELITEQKLETQYAVQLEFKGEVDGSEVEMFFISFVEIFMSAFVDKMVIKGKGWPRERRLDAPENLKRDVRLNLSALKKLVNTKTYNPAFSVTITCGNMTYDMVDQSLEKTDSNIIERPKKEEEEENDN